MEPSAADTSQTTSRSADMLRRLNSIKAQLESSRPQESNAKPKSTSVKLWKELSLPAKLSFAASIPAAVNWVIAAIKKRPPEEVTLHAVNAISQAVGLYGLRKMYKEMRKKIGVKMTVSPVYQIFSFIGSSLSTLALYARHKAGYGRSMFLISALYTVVYGYFLYLNYMYNKGLQAPGADKEKGVVHLPSLIGYSVVVVVTVSVWAKEIRAALIGGKSYEVLAMSGFLVSAFGILRAALATVTTSVPAISPFSSVAPLVGSHVLQLLALPLTNFSASPVLRVVVMGHFAIIYCLLVMALLALKMKKAKKLRRRARAAAAL